MDDYGSWIETGVRTIAAGAGVPDFVFAPEVVRKGGATREVGDVILWIGRHAVVVSVKARDPDAGPDSPDRRTSWLNKSVRAAARQIDGTTRRLQTTDTGLTLTSERGVRVPWKPGLVETISGVVVVDHPQADDYTPPFLECRVPTVVMSMSSWRLLHECLWSTASVVEYVQWRTRNGVPPLPLVAEPDVIASAHVAENDLPVGTPFEIRPGAWEDAWYNRPELFLFRAPDHRFALVMDALIAGAGEQDPEFTNIDNVFDYLAIVEFLDRIPPFPRMNLGKRMIDKCRTAGSIGGYDALLSIAHRDPPGLLFFLADASPRDERKQRLVGLTLARHSQLSEALGRSDVTTLGVATEGMPTQGRSHDFAFVRDPVSFSVEERKLRDEACGVLPAEFIGALR